MKSKAWQVMMSGVLAFLFASSQSMAIEPAAVSKECLKTFAEPEHMIFVQCFVPEAWKSTTGTQREQVDPFIVFTTKYSVFLVGEVFAKEGYTLESSGYEKVLSSVVLSTDGKEYRPIDIEQLPAKESNLAYQLQEFGNQVLSASGARMWLMVFPHAGKNGVRYVDPTVDGSFSIKYGAREFAWRTPFASLLPEVRDPVSGELFPGNFRFNPYTGNALSPKLDTK